MPTLTANNTSLTYTDLEVFDDISDINPNQGSMHTDCLTGFQVDVDVEAINNEGEEKLLHLGFACIETNCGIEAYSGFSMCRSGYDNDQYSELEEFFDYDMDAWELLLDEVEKLAKAEIQELTGEGN